MANNIWILGSALPLIRNLQPLSRQYGYHLALGGGVLNKGASDKDLDLYYLPLDNGNPQDPDGLVKDLEAMFGPSDPIQGDGYGLEDSPYKRKLKFLQNDRIDVFIV